MEKAQLRGIMEEVESQLSFILNDIQIGESNDIDELARIVRISLQVPIENGSDYTADLYKYPSLLKEWIEIYKVDYNKTVDLLQRIIEHDCKESYQIVKDILTSNTEINGPYYLRLRPYLINDNNKELRQKALNELDAYDPNLEGKNYLFTDSSGEEYFGYRKVWHLMQYGDRKNKETIIRQWDTNGLDCTFTAAIDFALWKKDHFPIKTDEDKQISMETENLLTKMHTQDRLNYFNEYL